MWSHIDIELLNRLPKKPMNGANADSPSWSRVATVLAVFNQEYTEDDWDGQGAAAISYAVIECASEFAKSLEMRGVAAPLWTIPTFESSVAFEWDRLDGSSIEIEITSSRYFTREKQTPFQAARLANSFSPIAAGL